MIYVNYKAYDGSGTSITDGYVFVKRNLPKTQSDMESLISLIQNECKLSKVFINFMHQLEQ